MDKRRTWLLFGALYHITMDGRMNLPLRSLLSVPAGVAVVSGIQRLGSAIHPRLDSPREPDQP